MLAGLVAVATEPKPSDEAQVEMWIRQLDSDDLAGRILPFMLGAGVKADRETVRHLVPLLQERLVTLSDAIEMTDFVFANEIRYAADQLIGKGMTREQARQVLDEAQALLANAPDFDEESIERLLRAKAEEMGLKLRQFLGTIRVALTGKEVSLPLFGTVAILGRATVLTRLAQARSLL